MRATTVFLLCASVLAWAVPCGARNETVFRAAQTGDVAKLKELVEASPDLVNARDEESNTPLHVASLMGRMESALYLLEQGAAVDALNAVGQSPLLYAAYAGRAALVDTLIARGSPFESRDTRGYAPIDFAARQGNEAVVELLVSKGAAFDERGYKGRTPLFLAAMNGRTGVVKALAARGAKLDTKDDEGGTPLSSALSGGRTETAEFLLDAGFAIDGDAAALERYAHLAAAAGSRRIVDALVEKGLSLDGADATGRTLLHQAAVGGLADFAEKVIRSLSSVDAADSLGRTALHYAAGRNRIEVARVLLREGADPNVADADGRTPLHIADDAGWDGIAKLLRSSGARDVERRVYRLARESGAARGEGAESLPLDITYVANEGFLIERGDKKILIDALHRNPWNYPQTGERVFSMILEGKPPFDGIDLSIASHAHQDHMSARMNVDLLVRNPGVAFVSSPEARDSMRAAAGAGFDGIAERVVSVDPPWREVARLRRNGVDLELFGVNHAGPGEPPYKTLATVIDLGGIRLAHLADEQSAVNVENFRSVDLAGRGIDVAFADRMMLSDSVGQYILRELVKPRYIILMHESEQDLDSARRNLAPIHPNLLIFREQLERRRFAR